MVESVRISSFSHFYVCTQQNSSPSGKKFDKYSERKAARSSSKKQSSGKSTKEYTKVDKEDPRSRLHFVKYMKKDGKTIKIWECGICELQLWQIQVTVTADKLVCELLPTLLGQIN